MESMPKPSAQPHVTSTPQPQELLYRKPSESRTELAFRLLRIAQYITTTPWQILHIAAQQMIDIHSETERNDIIMQWAKDKRAEFKYVSLAVCTNSLSLPPNSSPLPQPPPAS